MFDRVGGDEVDGMVIAFHAIRTASDSRDISHSGIKPMERTHIHLMWADEPCGIPDALYKEGKWQHFAAVDMTLVPDLEMFQSRTGTLLVRDDIPTSAILGIYIREEFRE